MELPDTKRVKISELIVKFKKKKKCSIREFSSFVGLLVSSCPAVRYGVLYTKSFEREKFLWLEHAHGDYNGNMNLSETLFDDFSWWQNNIMQGYQPIRQFNYCLEIFSDASTTDWGAFCNAQKAHGWWSEKERSLHINYLELVRLFMG